MEHSAKQKQILRATSIIGGPAVLNVLIGVLRTKVAALILGAAGLGLIGLFHNLITLVASFASYGIGNVATRQMSQADAQAQPSVGRAFLWAAAGLALLALTALLLGREPIARLVLGDASFADEVGWLSIGAAMLVLTYYQNGMLTGLRRVGDLARVSLISAALGAVLGIAALLAWREQGIIVFVIVSPAATVLVGAYLLLRARGAPTARPKFRDMAPQWSVLGRLGLSFTLAALAVTAGQLAVRSLVAQRLGADSLGHFQAAWMISMNYIGFILTAMASEYFPRLAAIIDDRPAASAAVNAQAEMALLLSGPILVATSGFAPILIPVMFSNDFSPAIELLRWQIVGDLMRIASWPLGVILLAAGKGRLFLICECIAAAVTAGVTFLAIDRWGLIAAGMAYVATNAIYLPLIYGLARRTIGYRPRAPAIGALIAVGAALATVTISAAWSAAAAMATASVLGAMLGIVAAIRLQKALPSPLRRMVECAVGHLPALKTLGR